MVEFRKNNYINNRRDNDFVVVETSRQSISWFNPLRYTMALLALISAMSSVIIIMVMAPGEQQFLSLIISLMVSLLGIVGSLKIDLTLSGLYCCLQLLFLVIQVRYYNSTDMSVVSLTVPVLGWASINTLSSIARVFLQLLYSIASTAFMYGLWFNRSDNCSQVSRFVLTRI